MSDRCEPPPELRGVDGDFWLERAGVPSVHVWLASPQCWIFSGVRDVRPGKMHALGWRYISPVATPAEVEALRAERDDANAERNRVIEQYNQCHADYCTLRARVAELEGALRCVASTGWPPGDRTAAWEAAGKMHFFARTALEQAP